MRSASSAGGSDVPARMRPSARGRRSDAAAAHQHVRPAGLQHRAVGVDQQGRLPERVDQRAVAPLVRAEAARQRVGVQHDRQLARPDGRERQLGVGGRDDVDPQARRARRGAGQGACAGLEVGGQRAPVELGQAAGEAGEMRVEPLRLTVDHQQGLEHPERRIRVAERHPRHATADSVRGANSSGGVR